MSSKSKKVAKTPKSNIKSIPKILGASFDCGKNDINKYEKKISALPRNGKRRVMFVGEASYLCTGFSTYWRNVIKRLHKNPNIICGEIGSYSQEGDPRIKQVPWKFYPVIPSNPQEQQIYQQNYHEAQFGKLKGPIAFADFKPDIVVACRDNWHDLWITKDPFRDYFKFIWLTIPDSYPQKWEWLQSYNKTDVILTYSWFGKKVLEEQSRLGLAKINKIDPINVIDVCQAGVDLDVFKPLDKNKVKRTFGIPEHIKFVGTVMRNQPRKLYPRLIEAFTKFKKKYVNESKNVCLLLHTSVADVGWDNGKGILETIARCGVEQIVFFSYICHNCKAICVSTWRGHPAICPQCNQKALHNPNTNVGFPDEYLNMVYNLLDIYVQASICEGDAMPINEAKSAATPVLSVDYSAMYEKNRNGGAMPIRIETIYNEGDTMQWRVLFDRDDLARKLASLFGNDKKRKKLSKEGRECAEKYYGWDLCAKKWEYHLLNTPIKNRDETWNAPIKIKEYSKEMGDNSLNDDEWLLWEYKNVLGRNGIDPEGKLHWKQQLKQGATRKQVHDYFVNMIKQENDKKLLLSGEKTSNQTPMQKVAQRVREIENDNK